VAAAGPFHDFRSAVEVRNRYPLCKPRRLQSPADTISYEFPSYPQGRQTSFSIFPFLFFSFHVYSFPVLPIATRSSYFSGCPLPYPSLDIVPTDGDGDKLIKSIKTEAAGCLAAENKEELRKLRLEERREKEISSM
jgi:hypothetical protein